jgi:hemolysin activation/secretion protein
LNRLWLAALLACAAPASLLAQPASGDLPRDRTGPQAAPAPLPAYPQPVPALTPPPTAAATPPATAAGGFGGPVTEVRVESAGPHGAARPPKGWTAPTEPGADLRLEHQPGQGLDESWVRSQFALNGLPGPGASISRALALVQLVNRAFLSAGFLNSGLVVRSASSAGVLDLGLVYGGLAPPAPGAPSLSVGWAAGGARGLNASYLADRLPSAYRRPLSGVELEHDFRLLAEDPAIRTVNADLRPGAHPGEASLALSIYPQDRYDLYVTGANDRSPSVGGQRVSAGGFVRNALAAGDLLSGQVGVTKGLKDAAFGYSIPFISPSNTLSVRGAMNNAAVVAQALLPLDIKARDRSGEIGLIHKFVDDPLLPAAVAGRWSPARRLTGGVLVTHRISRTYLQDLPFSFSPGSVEGRSHYTAVRLIGDYLVRNVDQVFAVSVTGTRGLGGTGSDVPGVPRPKRHFGAVLAQVNYARRLSDRGLEVRARISGQLADSVLYSGERFSAGGETSVRGYRENLLLADRGVVGSVELGQPVNIFGQKAGASGFDWGAFQLTAFTDAAAVGNHDAPQPQHHIYSIGATVAWIPSDAVFARVTYGYALTKAQLTGKRDIQDRGLQFLVTVHPLRMMK